MKNTNFFLLTLCLLCFIFIGSAFTADDQGGGNGSGFTHMEGLDCTSCHSAWQSGSATLEEYIEMGHPVSISYFENYIANYSNVTSNNSGVDINKLTQYIGSL